MQHIKDLLQQLLGRGKRAGAENVTHEGRRFVSVPIDVAKADPHLRPYTARALCSFANDLLNRGETDKAIEQFKEVIGLEPNLAEAHANLGAALLQKQLVDEAIQALQQAVALNPALFEAQANLGTAFLTTGAVDKAIATYRTAIPLVRQQAARDKLTELLGIAEQRKSAQEILGSACQGAQDLDYEGLAAMISERIGRAMKESRIMIARGPFTDEQKRIFRYAIYKGAWNIREDVLENEMELREALVSMSCTEAGVPDQIRDALLRVVEHLPLHLPKPG